MTELLTSAASDPQQARSLAAAGLISPADAEAFVRSAEQRRRDEQDRLDPRRILAPVVEAYDAWQSTDSWIPFDSGDAGRMEHLEQQRSEALARLESALDATKAQERVHTRQGRAAPQDIVSRIAELQDARRVLSIGTGSKAKPITDEKRAERLGESLSPFRQQETQSYGTGGGSGTRGGSDPLSAFGAGGLPTGAELGEDFASTSDSASSSAGTGAPGLSAVPISQRGTRAALAPFSTQSAVTVAREMEEAGAPVNSTVVTVDQIREALRASAGRIRGGHRMNPSADAAAGTPDVDAVIRQFASGANPSLMIHDGDPDSPVAGATGQRQVAALVRSIAASEAERDALRARQPGMVRRGLAGARKVLGSGFKASDFDTMSGEPKRLSNGDYMVQWEGSAPVHVAAEDWPELQRSLELIFLGTD